MIFNFFLGFFTKKPIIDIDYLLTHRDKFFIIDLRSRQEFFDSHIVLDTKARTMNIPFTFFNKLWVSLIRFKRKRILLYGSNSKDVFYAYKLLKKKGFLVFMLKGGFLAYKKKMYF
ncbi:rhodanese-like domain-containing protein [Candidatus Woesearchaeota archaeon]|nr:rhodanese-like domain-containing protein [Candidatus Woesearchaeota archaeon]